MDTKNAAVQCVIFIHTFCFYLWLKLSGDDFFHKKKKTKQKTYMYLYNIENKTLSADKIELKILMDQKCLNQEFLIFVWLKT